MAIRKTLNPKTGFYELDKPKQHTTTLLERITMLEERVQQLEAQPTK